MSFEFAAGMPLLTLSKSKEIRFRTVSARFRGSENIAQENPESGCWRLKVVQSGGATSSPLLGFFSVFLIQRISGAPQHWRRGWDSNPRYGFP